MESPVWSSETLSPLSREMLVNAFATLPRVCQLQKPLLLINHKTAQEFEELQKAIVERPKKLREQIEARRVKAADGLQRVGLADYVEDLADRRELREVEKTLSQWHFYS